MSVVGILKKNVPKFVCCMVQFSMPAILDRVLRRASQTMYFAVLEVSKTGLGLQIGL